MGRGFNPRYHPVWQCPLTEYRPRPRAVAPILSSLYRWKLRQSSTAAASRVQPEAPRCIHRVRRPGRTTPWLSSRPPPATSPLHSLNSYQNTCIGHQCSTASVTCQQALGPMPPAQRHGRCRHGFCCHSLRSFLQKPQQGGSQQPGNRVCPKGCAHDAVLFQSHAVHSAVPVRGAGE